MEKEVKLYYRGKEVIREINDCYSLCGDCVANKADGSCGMAMYPAGDEDYYCTDSENEYVFKYKEEAE